MLKHASTLLKIALSVAIVSFIAYKASANDQFVDILKSEKNWWYLILAQIFLVAGISLSFIRWRRLVQAIGIPFSYVDCLRIGFIGHMFGSISIGTFGSDAIRIYYISKENPGKKTEALAAVFIDRICGLLGLFLLTTITMFCFQYYGQSAILASHSKTLKSITWIAFGLTCGGLVGFGGLFVLPYLQKTRFVNKVIQFRWIGKLTEKALDAGIVYQSKPQELIIALFESVVVHTLLTMSVFSVAMGLCVNHPSLGDHLIISPISHLASVLPLPGGFGGLEGALYFFYNSISEIENDTTGLVVALAYRIELLIAAVIGVVFYLRGRKELSEITHQELSALAESDQAEKPETA